MRHFPSTFLLLFEQVAIGGLFALAAAPFHELARGFFKSTGGVLFVFGLLGFAGKFELHRKASAIGTAEAVELLLYGLFLVFFALYLFSLWKENAPFRARVFALSLLSGTAALATGGALYTTAPLLSVETVLYPMSLFVSALLLGGVSVGMLIGHWYLIDTGQSLEPFLRLFRFFVFWLLVEAVFVWILFAAIYFLGSPSSVAGLERLWSQHRTLLFARVLISHAGPLVIAYMIRHTLKIPQTMAATGLFYVALLGVFVGEILGRQILALTAVPF
jgi:hypothetical protein